MVLSQFDVQIRCMEIKRADHGAALPKGFTLRDGDFRPISSTGLCYSVEIKDSHIPPWIISNICDLMASEGRSFEARYIILTFPKHICYVNELVSDNLKAIND